MTEAEWIACTDPKKMLAGLESNTNHRKLALFAFACCRRVWHLLPEQRRGQELIEASEQLLDGQASAWAAVEARYGPKDGWDWHKDCRRIGDPAGVAVEAAHAGEGLARRLAKDAAKAAARVVGEAAQDAAPRPRNATRLTGPALLQAAEAVLAAGRPASDAEKQAQCAILRDLFGPLPFRPFAVSPSWLTTACLAFARQMYDSRDFSQMPLLADALEEAGCTNADILSHCRQPGEHVRGCWAVDLLLSKS